MWVQRRGSDSRMLGGVSHKDVDTGNRHQSTLNEGRDSSKRTSKPTAHVPACAPPQRVPCRRARRRRRAPPRPAAGPASPPPARRPRPADVWVGRWGRRVRQVVGAAGLVDKEAIGWAPSHAHPQTTAPRRPPALAPPRASQGRWRAGAAGRCPATKTRGEGAARARPAGRQQGTGGQGRRGQRR